MKIRKATPDDLDALVQLRLDFLCEEHGEFPPESRDAFRRQWADFFTGHLGCDCLAYVADTDEELVSVALLLLVEKPANFRYPTGRTGQLLNVYTRPAYRRRGLATLILQALLVEAAQRQVSLLELAATPAGKALYEKLGFRETDSAYTAMQLPRSEG
ncbi:GNAT family N-acetyltransferase [Victivallis sp. Marseille-Q1083]|uniref:GNAT family N-acetyltransferase n=1 Tax=Victivallis sp. Marseille-Q1083 TaxID=2717288 RepID=UPI0015894585|nr:GNAT family N-acetyltransferase [Victivallis sp. Marseille-Q1083]